MIVQLDADYVQARPTKALSRLVSYALFEGRPVTTRGRWINPLVFGQLAVAKKIPQLKSVRRPLFIVGTGRSGTTILGKVLSLHRDVGFLNEPKALWHAIHPHEDVIGNYDRGPAAYRLGASDADEAVVRRAHRVFGAYLATVGATRVLNKYPELVFRIPFVRSIFPDARFLFVVRNGWDTVRSVAAWSERHGTTGDGEPRDWWGVDDRKWRLLVEQVATTHPALQGRREELLGLDRHVDRAALEWALAMNEGMEHEEKDPNAVTRVHYEDLVFAPRKTIRRVFKRCHLSEDNAPLAYAQQTIRTAPSKAAIDLAPRIAPLFHETMMALGYA
jgi:hypothetical protein